MTTLGDLGEREMIRRFRNMFPKGDHVIHGIGDDCAVIRPYDESPIDLILTSDAVISGTHFDDSATSADIGHKAVARLLSDIAAMGGAPQWALLNIVAPSTLPAEQIEDICSGISATASRHGLTIVGGDTAGGPKLELHLFAIGTLPRDTAVTRSGASAGDILYVTGIIGNSIAGRHLRFDPRIRHGSWLRENRYATAMIDLSDGLAVDLEHLCGMSGIGAEIRTDLLPATESLSGHADAVARAIGDGEDYELLFAVPAAMAEEFEKRWHERFPNLPAARIGHATETPGRIIYLDECGKVFDLSGLGYEHFTNDE